MAPNSNVPDGLSRPGELRCSAGHLGGKPRARNGKARQGQGQGSQKGSVQVIPPSSSYQMFGKTDQPGQIRSQ